MADGVQQLRDSLTQSAGSAASAHTPATDARRLLGCEVDKHAPALNSGNPTVRQGAMRELMEFANEHGLSGRDLANALRGFRARERSGPGAQTDAHDLACIMDRSRTLNNAQRGGAGNLNRLLDGLRVPE